MHIFIAGTDTGVGKTFVASLLVRALNAAGRRCVGFKPVACGDRDDAIELWKAGDPTATLDEINPVWLETPAAPLLAARIEKRTIRFDQLVSAAHSLVQRFDAVVIEGAGGWLTPLTGQTTMATLAQAFGAPVLLVAANRLGALNHTLLTVSAVRSADLPLSSIILNDVTSEIGPAVESNYEVLRELVSPLSVFKLGKGSEGLPADLLRQF